MTASRPAAPLAGPLPALDPLTRLAIRHGTDKFGQHLYTPIYHRLFAHLRDQPIRILEIGIGWPNVSVLGGASLRMWRDYFPHAQLVGIDLQPKRMNLGERVHIAQGSQTDPQFLQQLAATYGPFDVVIDDGSHRVNDVLVTFDTLYPLMRNGGLYAVEDVQTAFWPDFGGNPMAQDSIVSRVHDMVRAMHAAEAAAAGQAAPQDRYGAITASIQVHRNLIVFERGDNDYPSNRAFALAHPAVQAVLRQLDQVRDQDASVGQVLIRLGMLEVAGAVTEAVPVARDGLRQFPDSLPLLCILQHMTWQIGERDESRALLARMLQLAPDEPVFRLIDQQMRQG